MKALGHALKNRFRTDAPQMLVYGSWARGKANENSDVDVLLLFPARVQPGQEINRISTDLAEINLQYGVLISVLPVYEPDYQKNRGAFWHNVRQEARHVEAL